LLQETHEELSHQRIKTEGKVIGREKGSIRRRLIAAHSAARLIELAVTLKSIARLIKLSLAL
jgi:hypothetical protein